MRFDVDFFEKRKNELSKEVKELEKKSGQMSIIRLALFLLSAGTLITGLVIKQELILGVIAGLIFVAFIVLCVKHHKVNTDYKFKKTLFDINEEYISRVKGNFDGLKDKGTEFTVPDHDYCVDLDVFGETSLFALYNISESAFGRSAFKHELLNAHILGRSNSELILRQKAVHEFSDKIDFLQKYQTLERMGRLDKMPVALIALASNKALTFSKTKRILSRIILLLWLIPFALLFVSTKLFVTGALGVILVNLIASFLMSSCYREYFNAVDGITRQTKALHSLYKILEDEGFKEELNVQLIKDSKTGKKVSEGLESLAKACAITRFRSQPLLAIVLNCLCLYDCFCADKLVNWAEKYGVSLEGNIKNLGVIESLMSASMVEVISAHSCVPTFACDDQDSPKNAYFKGTDMLHPLLDPSKAVSNSITIDSKIALITGSNMSGKTTLIRTIGVNAVLSYMGANALASSLEIGRMRVVSSMRIVDSMKEEMSTFKAELVRISNIVNAGREGRPLLFLIDEIFRGTNSADRTSGAMTVLKILSSDKIIGLMTTHDYALCDQAKTELSNICYYHFSETYDDEGIYFDYKLKDGVSNISNAKYLMKLVGIIV
ncbi:MAG: hypothetical protein J6U54_14785 [Clostridiales bacterium]|nr:hypothetical protein [Clostridiales bacterium]